MKKIIVLTIPVSEVQQILRDGNYLKTDEVISSISLEGNDIIFNCSLEAEQKVGAMEKLLAIKLADCDPGLSVRTFYCLKPANILTIGKLIENSKSDLLKFRNLGKGSLGEIEVFLKTKNLKLKDE